MLLMEINLKWIFKENLIENKLSKPTANLIDDIWCAIK